MGPRARYLGNDVPSEVLIWQDPVPAVDHKLISAEDAEKLKAQILKSGLSVSELMRTAWASASSFRGSDMRGGANGARLSLAPQKDWDVNNPAEVAKVLEKLEAIQSKFNKSLRNGKKVSLADTIILAGDAAIEKAAEDAGMQTSVPFMPGRMDTTQAMTDVTSFNLLEPKADAFRNYFNAEESYKSPTEMLVDRADQLNLTVPEMTVLIGGMRALGANHSGSSHGVFTDRPGTLTNDFFVNLLDMSTMWRNAGDGVYEGVNRSSGEVVYTATPVDLIFGSNSELRAIAEAYAYNDSKQLFVDDFVAAWTKVKQADRF